MKLSLVIPCYNEEDNVELFYKEVNDCFEEQIMDYEFIFVNDGSQDKTMNKLKKLYKQREKDNIKVIGFSRNFGKEAAIYAGLQQAEGEYTAIIDADLQQRPQVVLSMVEILDKEEEYDCVAAFQDKRNEGMILSFFKRAFYKIINMVADTKFVSGASDFRCFRKNMRLAIISMSEYHRFSKGIFSWVGFETKYIPYKAEKRNAGTSKWSFRKLYKYGMDGILSFSIAPLKLATYVGTICAFLALVYMFVIFLQKLMFGIDVPGHATVVTLILFIGGVQLFFLGVLGEYISKMYIQEKKRPIYITRETFGVAEKKEEDELSDKKE
ncbi:MAG: glycosyltransferase family 2 protein [Lachnospiraceae bacterium]|nr:glycosyltransferase family 2 protein [Lachnospiraceae bacterium]